LCTRVGSKRHERNTTSCLLSVYDAALIVNNDKKRGKRDSRARANLIGAAVIRNLPALSRYLQAVVPNYHESLLSSAWRASRSRIPVSRRAIALITPA
jgi:hypothetical protein